ncbi:tetratricopeptide repeat protein 39B isoform X2 [Folsomia candida]|uniref:tetratricopeptide repeat protein 39B isoform X2 n=1 Tax=Folsomia candida TaxID=158441 RepID=UPI000B9042A2|nr:tetratricopeptide repeat protein 39B isoform X2 [Folsomia candida]
MSDSDGDEDPFYDAVEYLAKAGPMDLGTGIEESKLAISLFMNNRFAEARALLKPWADESMYHALGYGVFEFLEAVLTFEQQHIESAAETLEQSVQVCNKFRKKNSMYESLGKIVRRPNYDALTEEEIHAELCYAECLLLRAVLTFIEDENLISFVKGGLRMRSCLKCYRECWNILRYRNWDGSLHKDHFESGVRMGVGAYNLLISMLPAKIMKLLEFIGFSGNRETGLGQLHLGCDLAGSLRQILCSMVLLGFHLFVSYVLGYGDGDLVLAERLINQQLSSFPDGVWYNFFKGRLEYVKGNVNPAIEWYSRAWQSQSEWVQFHHLCYWELMWANCFKQDWISSRDFADLLLHESRWSRTIYGYQKASFMCMMSEKLGRFETAELLQLFKDIPGWKQRIAGKSIPMEKFAVKKCERFFAQGNKLILPAVELLYLWNGFKVLGKQGDLVRPLLALVERHVRDLAREKDGGGGFYVDNLCLLLLLRGMCLRYLDRVGEAEADFLGVIAYEKQLLHDAYLVPYSTYELAMSYWSQGNTQGAEVTLENAKNNYKGYALESRLHFRIHSALSELRASRSVGQAGGTTSNGRKTSVPFL